MRGLRAGGPRRAGLSRRRFLGLAAGGAWALAGCTASPAPAARPTAAPVAAAPTVASAAGAPPPPAATLTRARITYVAQSATFGPLWAAADAGYFAKYGIDLELGHIPGATRLQQALLAGEVDYAVVAGTPAISASLAGSPCPIIAEQIDLPVWYLVVRPEITSTADLRGRRVGITQLGSGSDFVMRKALRAWGFEPERDVQLVQMGGTQEIFAGLAGGAIDAGPMAAPLHLRARREGYPPLLDLADTGIHYPQQVVTATRTYLDAHPGQAQNVLRALAEGTRRYKTDRALALALLAKYSGDTDPEQLQSAWEAAVKLIKDVPTISEDGVQAVLDDAAAERPEARGARVADVVDPRYVRELEAEGFFARLAAGGG